MAGYNRIIMIGNLTKDPDLKQLANGQVCRLNVAANRQFKNRQTGAMVQEVCFVDVDVWGAQADSCKQYLQKGRPVLVEGRLKLDSWKDNDGGMRSKHSIVADKIVFLGSGNNGSNDKTSGATLDSDSFAGASSSSFANSASSSNNAAAVFKDEPPFEDELPF
jgi:single-strand DNA-binding protein